MKKSIHKRIFLNCNFKIKLLHSNRNHLLINKNKFSKNYLRKRFFLKNYKFLKKNF